MASVFYQILYWLKNLTGLILTVWLESVKNVKIFPRQNFPLYGITNHIVEFVVAKRVNACSQSVIKICIDKEYE